MSSKTEEYTQDMCATTVNEEPLELSDLPNSLKPSRAEGTLDEKKKQHLLTQEKLLTAKSDKLRRQLVLIKKISFYEKKTILIFSDGSQPWKTSAVAVIGNLAITQS